MKNLHKLEIKNPYDPTKKLPITMLVDIKRENITQDYLKDLRKNILDNGVHLALIVCEREPDPAVYESLSSYLPQVILIITEHKDLVKLLVISQAKRKGLEIDADLLSNTYKRMFEKFDLDKKIQEWIKKMKDNGYFLTYEGFVNDRVSACRFFINTIEELPLSLEEIYKKNLELRNLLPYGIKSELIPDMQLGTLNKISETLKNYGFLREENGKFIIQLHPSEKRIKELLDYYGGKTDKSTLMKHFILSETAVFDSLIDHMKRKFRLSVEGDVISLLELRDLKKIREVVINSFENSKNKLKQSYNPFQNILTWKSRTWDIIPLSKVEEFIYSYLSKISEASDEDVIGPYTFIITELCKWYERYVKKIIYAYKESEELIKSLNYHINDIQKTFEQVINDIKKSIQLDYKQVELDELTKFKTELKDIENFMSSQVSSEELKKNIKVFLEGRLVEGKTKIEELRTDIDEKIEKEGIKGDWTIAEYVWINNKVEKIRNEINFCKERISRLSELTKNLTEIVAKFYELAKKEPNIDRLKLAPIFLEYFEKLLQNRLKTPLFLPNLKKTNINDFYNTLSKRVKSLQNEYEEYEKIRKNLRGLYDMEVKLDKEIRKLDYFEICYEKFMEDKVPESISNKRKEIIREYEEISKSLDYEIDEIENLVSMDEKSHNIILEINKLIENGQKVYREYEVLFNNIKDKLESDLKFIKRFKDNIFPKLKNSDKDKIAGILNSLSIIYEECKKTLDNILIYISEGDNIIQIEKSSKVMLSKENELRQDLIKEIKDLDEKQTQLLMEIVKILPAQKNYWLPLTEIYKIIEEKKLLIAPDEVKRILMDLSEKGFLSIAIGFS